VNGAVRYSRGVTQTPVWVTGEALMAMEGKPLPIAAPARAGPSPAPVQSATSSHTTTAPGSAAPAAAHATAAKRAPAHTAPRHRGAPPVAKRRGASSASLARNQVLARNF